MKFCVDSLSLFIGCRVQPVAVPAGIFVFAGSSFHKVSTQTSYHLNATTFVTADLFSLSNLRQSSSKIHGRSKQDYSATFAQICIAAARADFAFFFGRGFSYFGRLPDSRQKRPAPGSQTPNQQSPEQVSTNGGPSRPPPEVHSNPSPRLSNPNNQPLPNIFMPLLSQQRTRPQQRLNLNNNRRNLNLSQNSLNLEEDAEESRIFSNNEDTDFDLMFSNNVDPVVGSYKQHMGLPADGALGNIAFADFQPKSYYA